MDKIIIAFGLLLVLLKLFSIITISWWIIAIPFVVEIGFFIACIAFLVWIKNK
ncbi:hypothetical protein [Pediococcus pentosaceus]|uniref:hypothetical protein n=1 Tax=Pediococcus pentosaceus TaxID=1255 RepID=UPI0018A195BE|nr:hypothetical protein [Pediococcus pentosaceus]MBF7122890.1 hypothetical protein [Pediococcus pentosaceus]WKF71872.1 hypothetical protein QYM39_04260 [Pediococcus pentosaceus]